ncbi:MAG TPA: type III pantothenate kinase [Bacteroidia bacterium]|nr:type III pantothenate kinase [Bacteroidia bacterium]
MNLIIDIGNTLTKLAIFNNDKLIEQWTEDNDTGKTSHANPGKNLDISNVILSTVTENNPLPPQTNKEKSFTIILDHSTPLPIKNKYKTPQTLGNDRLANAVGATLFFPKKNVLIIDLGTCIKYDFIDKRKNYPGGAISPGFEMRFKALKHYTAKLPLIKPSKKFSLTGNSTEQSILSGVQNGIIFEINGAIEQYKKKYDELKVILTGGDHAFFADHLKSSIFAAPNLTVQGLNEILNYNIRKKER